MSLCANMKFSTQEEKVQEIHIKSNFELSSIRHINGKFQVQTMNCLDKENQIKENGCNFLKKLSQRNSKDKQNDIEGFFNTQGSISNSLIKVNKYLLILKIEFLMEISGCLC